MKKIIALCLLICLLGCQSKPKEQVPDEPYVKNSERYRYTMESLEISEELNALLNGDNKARFFKAYNGKLLFEQRDETVLDQVGRTEALYEYDLHTQELRNLELPEENIKIWDAIYYQDQYIYIVCHKEDGLTTIIAENQNHETTVLFEEMGIAFMGHPSFEIAEDGLYYWFFQELDNQHYTKYQRITSALEVESLWEGEKEDDKPLCMVYSSQNAALTQKDETYTYLRDGKQISIEYPSEFKFIYLLTDYIILDEEQYFDLATKEWKRLNDAKMPDLKKSRFIDQNAILYVNDSKEVHVSQFNDGTFEDEKIGEISYGGSDLNYYRMNEEEILATHSYTKGTEDKQALYLIHREMIEE